MDKLILTLAESGLELVPRILWSEASVKKTASRRGKRPGEMLLDISLHYSAMKKLRDWRKRGRPDIVHVCLLVGLGTLLNRLGLMETVIHTYQGKVIFLDPRERVPRNYNRFVGLMEQLLIYGRVPVKSEKPLMWITGYDLESALFVKDSDYVFLLDENGEKVLPGLLAGHLVDFRRPSIIVGAFQSGDFKSSVRSLANEVVSLGKIKMDAWNVVARIISSVEDILKLYEGV